MKKIFIILLLIFASGIPISAEEITDDTKEIDISQIDSSYGTEDSSINIRNWNKKKGAQYYKGDIVFYDGQKFLVQKDFISTGKKDQIYDTTLFKPIVEVGPEISTGIAPRIETCAGGGSWKTVATNQTKTNIINKGLSDIYRKTSHYSLSTTKSHSQSATLSGYGVTISYASGSTSGGGWGLTNIDPKRFSRMRTNVKGYVQRKTLTNCSTVNRFVKTHEWITVFYEK